MIERFHRERNHSKNTILNYNRSIRYYETLTKHTMEELLKIAETEETQNIHWRNTQTRQWLLEYREYLYQNYNLSSAQTYLTVILTIYRHFELTIPTLPYYSTKHLRQSTMINYKDLPDRDLLQECLKISNPLVRSIILFMSSSGVSRIDVLNLTIGDYLEATRDYHKHPESIKYAIQEMQDKDVIPTFHLTRQKTGQEYYTFCSHEAVKSINTYLLTRTDKLTKNRPLFKINKRYINQVFEKLNHYFQLGKQPNNVYNRLTPHMLRKYHASQLAEAGMPTDHINILQGRKIPGVAHRHYIRFKPETLREEYIEALPYLVIEEVNKYKTELQSTKEENITLKDNLRGILARIEKLENG